MSEGPTFKYHCETTSTTFKMWFVCPRQLLLREDWEQLVWDETLRQAHSRGIIPVGSVLVEACEVSATGPLVEGQPVPVFRSRILGEVDLVKVCSEVMVGATL